MYRRQPGFDAAGFHAALARGEDIDIQAAIEPVTVKVEREEPLRAELRSFLRSAQHGTTPVVDADAGIRALEVACEIERLLHEAS